jgi:hypothetical protein
MLTDDASPLVVAFREHLARIAASGAAFRRKADGICFVIPGRLSSRYFPEGRARIAEKLAARMDATPAHGVLLTLTINPAGYGAPVDSLRGHAGIWSRWGRFRTQLQRRHKLRLPYVAVLEFHKSGWPHLHIFFPGVTWLAPQAWLQARWGNIAHVVHLRDGAGPYVVKYLRKMSNLPDANAAAMRESRARFFNFSRCLATSLRKGPAMAEFLGHILHPGLATTSRVLLAHELATIATPHYRPARNMSIESDATLYPQVYDAGNP